jgi:hypothetical protein
MFRLVFHVLLIAEFFFSGFAHAESVPNPPDPLEVDLEISSLGPSPPEPDRLRVKVSRLKRSRGSDFTGTWTCPGRGRIILSQVGGNVNGSVGGKDNEHFGRHHRNGGTVSGRVVDDVMNLTWSLGDGTTTISKSTLSENWNELNSHWTWYSSRGNKLSNGTMKCHR